MLGGLTPQLHSRRITIQAGLHLFEHLFIFPSADASVFAGAAFWILGRSADGLMTSTCRSPSLSRCS
jgi:hypothetical protein